MLQGQHKDILTSHMFIFRPLCTFLAKRHELTTKFNHQFDTFRTGPKICIAMNMYFGHKSSNDLMNAVSHISDGLLEKDKKNVNNVAKLVATVVNCQYTLKRHMWNDISDEWPFYTDQERALFRYWIFSKAKISIDEKEKHGRFVN